MTLTLNVVVPPLPSLTVTVKASVSTLGVVNAPHLASTTGSDDNKKGTDDTKGSTDTTVSKTGTKSSSGTTKSGDTAKAGASTGAGGSDHDSDGGSDNN